MLGFRSSSRAAFSSLCIASYIPVVLFLEGIAHFFRELRNQSLNARQDRMKSKCITWSGSPPSCEIIVLPVGVPSGPISSRAWFARGSIFCRYQLRINAAELSRVSFMECTAKQYMAVLPSNSGRSSLIILSFLKYHSQDREGQKKLNCTTATAPNPFEPRPFGCFSALPARPW